MLISEDSRLAPLSGCMTKWEYKVVGDTNNESLEERLNELGREDWEVVAGGIGGGHYTNSQFVLKRPL